MSRTLARAAAATVAAALMVGGVAVSAEAAPKHLEAPTASAPKHL